MMVAVSFSDPSLKEKAQQLANRLKIPCVEDTSSEHAYHLRVTQTHIELKSKINKILKPLVVDFLQGKQMHRRVHGGGRGQMIAKACGVKKGETPNILDVTAGLGRDAFVLACLGCEVTMVERSEILYILLEDGIKRLRADEELSAQLKLNLVFDDAKHYLQTLSPFPDVIYMDPMFPERKKSALVKKEMIILQDIVGEDNDSEALLDFALTHATKRVVVKRPRLAQTLGDKRPHHQTIGKSSRFDVYIAHITN